MNAHPCRGWLVNHRPVRGQTSRNFTTNGKTYAEGPDRAISGFKDMHGPRQSLVRRASIRRAMNRRTLCNRPNQGRHELPYPAHSGATFQTAMFGKSPSGAKCLRNLSVTEINAVTVVT
jgi:hypothetical protein